MKLNIGIFGANIYNGNRGVGALAYSTLSLLDEVLSSTDVTPTYTFINTDYNGKYQDEIILGERTIQIHNISPIHIVGFKSFIKFIIDFNQLKSLAKYLKVDVLLNVGGGDSFSDIYGISRFKSINVQNVFFRKLLKKTVFLPQTIGPFANSNVKKSAIKSLNAASYVFARDLQSYSFIKLNTKQKACAESIDMAFFMPFKEHLFNDDYIHVGINVSALLWNGGYSGSNQFNLKVDYQNFTKEVIKRFLSYPNTKVHIVPHVVHSYSHIENDYEVSQKLCTEFDSPNIILAPFFLTPIQAKNYISGLDFFTGARMHAAIAAYSSKVAVFPLAYSRKFNGLFKDTLNYRFMGDMVNSLESEILHQLFDSYEQRDFLKKQTTDSMYTFVETRHNELKAEMEQVLLSIKR